MVNTWDVNLYFTLFFIICIYAYGLLLWVILEFDDQVDWWTSTWGFESVVHLVASCRSSYRIYPDYVGLRLVIVYDRLKLRTFTRTRTQNATCIPIVLPKKYISIKPNGSTSCVFSVLYCASCVRSMKLCPLIRKWNQETPFGMTNDGDKNTVAWGRSVGPAGKNTCISYSSL